MDDDSKYEYVCGDARIRRACSDDMDDIWAIIESAREYLLYCRVDQWQDGFPSRTTIADDIGRNEAYMLCCGDSLAGYVVFGEHCEECYETLSGGKWLNTQLDYGVIHRTAIRAEYRNHGLSSVLFDFCENRALSLNMASVRIDTHRDNFVMRRILAQRGYTECGEIRLYRGMDEPRLRRIGYERLLYHTDPAGTEYTVRYIASEEELTRCLDIRNEVFVAEQGVDASLEYEECDAVLLPCMHIILLVDGVPAGTARFVSSNEAHSVKLGRFALLKQYRTRGWGRVLMNGVIELARAAGYSAICISAQVQARGFYEKCGFICTNCQVFLEAGIPHVGMRLVL